MKLPDLLTRLKAVKKTGAGWQACCPAHEDKRASLSVSEGKAGALLVHCHAGCSPAAITAALGLEWKDLFPEKPARRVARESLRSQGKIVASYDYLDEGKRLLFQVCRFEPKDFRQRRPDPGGKGGWTWNTTGVRKVLYRLPELLAALREKPEEAVWIVEGEKDVEALRRAGCCATCNAGGAGKWRAELAAPLQPARNLIVVADKDKPGRAHAQAIAASLARKGRRVAVIEAPGALNKDVSDFLGRGGQVAELLELATAAPAVQPTGPVEASLELPGCVFDLARQRFYIPAGGEWIPVSDTRATVYFKRAGFSEWSKDSLGISTLEHALHQVVTERNVLFAGQIAGYWPGAAVVSGQRVLITRGPKLLEPKAGPWPGLQALLREMFYDEALGEQQWSVFCGWVKTAYESLRDKTFRPGLVLVLCGPPASGKSFLQGLLTILLGGRSANPYLYMTGRTEFNLDLMGAEHLTIDDEASERDIKSRQAFGQNVKKLAVGHTAALHGKGRDAITITRYARVTACLNDDPGDLMVLPPMDPAVADKFALLRVRPAKFPLMKGPEDFKVFRARIVSELPAFLDFLLRQFTIPAALASARFGVASWHHPELLVELEDLHPWRRLMELIDHVRPWAVDAALGRGDIWEGTVQDLEEILIQKAEGRARSVLRGPQGTGHDLRSARQRMPHRISFRESMGRRIWIIKREPV